MEMCICNITFVLLFSFYYKIFVYYFFSRSALYFIQRNDIAMAITKYDQFDFLIDIVPRDELKPTKRQVFNFLLFLFKKKISCLKEIFLYPTFM